jgi:hypothetical protein
MLMKEENKSSISDASKHFIEIEKTQKDHKKHFNHDKVIIDHRSLMRFFCIETFSRESIREKFGRIITNH